MARTIRNLDKVLTKALVCRTTTWTVSIQEVYSSMKSLTALAAVLVIVGGLNWGLVAMAEFDLVAWLFGEEFGTTNAASRIVYGLVGLAAVYGAVVLIGQRSGHGARTVTAR